MSTINYTYNVIVDRFRQFAAGHFQLRRFTHGEISQADLEKEAEWPWLHVKPRAINYSPGTRSFSFEIFISDLPRDKEDKTGYQAESITDCSLIFQDLINEIYLGNMFGTDVLLTRPVNAEPFVEQYTHTLTGVTGTIELSLDYDWSACSIPASWNYNTPTDSGSDGWGALQFIESLDQNGAYVSLLNDEEAPGNSYYYGTDAEGVKGWHAIVDNIGLTCETLPDCATIITILEDIEALQSDKVDKVAGKGLSTEDYTTAEKSKLAGIQAGAEVNVNADWNAFSGDAQILNKPSIPAAQVNSDWNATSGVAQILNKPTIPSIAGLVPETRTLTINGTTQDLSANRTFTIATGLTVGTTPITSGTVGRVLFEGTGNVLQESANFFWDNTNSRLGIGTASPNSRINALDGTVSELKFNSGTAALTPSLAVGNTGGSGKFAALVAGTTGSAFIYDSVGVFDIATEPKSSYTANTLGGGGLTSRLRITAGGNVLIGTTTDAGFRLDVNGAARIQNDLTITDTFKIVSSTNANTKVTFASNLSLQGQGGILLQGGHFITLNGVVFGATSVNASAVLQADSTNRGFLPPRMTTTQKNAIASPASGLVVYDTTLGKLCVRGAAAWETITSV
jgi:hypothetical protein